MSLCMKTTTKAEPMTTTLRAGDLVMWREQMAEVISSDSWMTILTFGGRTELADTKDVRFVDRA